MIHPDSLPPNWPHRRTATLCSLALLLGACDSARLVQPDAPNLEVEAAAADRTFPTVRVSQRAPAAGSRVPVVSNLADAVTRVAPGGTIEVEEGTYVTQPVSINKPLTIRRANAQFPTASASMTYDYSKNPVFVGTEGPHIVHIKDVAGGQVRMHGISFECGVGSAVLVEDGHDGIQIRHSQFSPASGAQSRCLSLRINSTSEKLIDIGSSIFSRAGAWIINPGGALRVTESTFRGSRVTLSRLTSVTLLQNKFVASEVGSSNAGSGTIQENEFSECGSRCLIVGGNSAGDGSEVHILSNHFSAPLATSSQLAAQIVHMDRAVVQRNTIVGEPGGPFGYSFTIGISLNSVTNAIVSGNAITYARDALNVTSFAEGGRVTNVNAENNNFAHVRSPVSGSWSTGQGYRNTLSMRGNNFSGYNSAVLGARAFWKLDLSCNWWGSANGPSNYGDAVPSSFHDWRTAAARPWDGIECDTLPPGYFRPRGLPSPLLMKCSDAISHPGYISGRHTLNPIGQACPSTDYAQYVGRFDDKPLGTEIEVCESSLSYEYETLYPRYHPKYYGWVAVGRRGELNKCHGSEGYLLNSMVKLRRDG